MSSLIPLYTVLLALYELPTIASLLRGRVVAKATLWFGSSPLFEKRSYACLYAGVLALLVVSRLLAGALPRHRYVQLHNAILHTVEVFLFLSLAQCKEGPVSTEGIALLAVMGLNCALFVWQAVAAFRPHEKPALQSVVNTHKKNI